MRTQRLLFLIFPLIFVGCHKDTFNTRPSIELKSVSTREVIPSVPSDQTPPLILTFTFTDAEGDLAGARIGIIKEVGNCPNSNFIDTLSYAISPDLPVKKNSKADLDIIFPYIKLGSACTFNDSDPFKGDSAVFKVWVIDNAGNISDTANTGLIRIHSN